MVRRFSSAYLFISVCAGLTLFSACNREQTLQSASVHDDVAAEYAQTLDGAEYTGDAVCASCHQELYDGFQEHGMANSLYRPEDIQRDVQIPSEAIYHDKSNLHYRVFERRDSLFQEEFRLDDQGRVIHRLIKPASFVVGSGTAALTFLTQEAGRLFELPLTWYTQGERWDFSPGYRENNFRFTRAIPDRCMACHNSYPESIPYVNGGYSEVPEGIGCERCHGPGSLHVDERLASSDSDSTDTSIDYTIVNPAHLSLERKLDVCQQCHLNADVSILREGRKPDSFVPGDLLSSHVALFARPVEDERTTINVISHSDRMKQSECFLQTIDSSAPMDCVTCHNPHEGFRQASFDYFTATCNSCHPSQALLEDKAPGFVRDHQPETNCISCHMPKVEVRDAPHSSFTDHYIRVVRDSITSVPDAGQSSDFVPVLDNPVDNDVYLGMAYIIEGRQSDDVNLLEKGVDVLTTVLSDENKFGEAHFLLGLALSRLGRVDEAVPNLENAARLGAVIPERLNALAQAYETTQKRPGVIERVYKRALGIQPRAADIRVNYGRFLQSLGRLDEAESEYTRAAETNPTLTEPHFNLGLVALQKSEFEDARKHLARAVALDPDHAAAVSHIGLSYAIENKPTLAEENLRRGAEIGVQDATAQANLGAFLLNTARPSEAIPFLEKAIALDPAYADAMANLALAFLQTDREDDAITMATSALQFNPDHPLATQILQSVE